MRIEITDVRKIGNTVGIWGRSETGEESFAQFLDYPFSLEDVVGALAMNLGAVRIPSPEECPSSEKVKLSNEALFMSYVRKKEEVRDEPSVLSTATHERLIGSGG